MADEEQMREARQIWTRVVEVDVIVREAGVKRWVNVIVRKVGVIGRGGDGGGDVKRIETDDT